MPLTVCPVELVAAPVEAVRANLVDWQPLSQGADVQVHPSIAEGPATPARPSPSDRAETLSAVASLFEVAYRAFLPELVGHDTALEANTGLPTIQAVAQITTPGPTGALVQVIAAPLAVLLAARSLFFRRRNPTVSPSFHPCQTVSRRL